MNLSVKSFVKISLTTVLSFNVATQSVANQNEIINENQRHAHQIKNVFDASAFYLPPYKFGHYGLRLFRQKQESRYKTAIEVDMLMKANTLNEIAHELTNQTAIETYLDKSLTIYKKNMTPVKKQKIIAMDEYPEYLFLGLGLLPALARIDDYGLKHQYDHRLRTLLNQYDFSEYVTDPEMLNSWAAQLANQVYYLKQIGEQDVEAIFINSFRKTLPDSNDTQMSDLAYKNKIYGLTHIVIAASQYYQKPIKEEDFQWIFDYYRKNIDMIIQRTNHDITAEVGLNFLLADLDNDHTLKKIQKHVIAKIDPELSIVPSGSGIIGLEKKLGVAEHSNVLAIMLLDWQDPKFAPTYNKHPEIFSSLPYGLEAK